MGLAIRGIVAHGSQVLAGVLLGIALLFQSVIAELAAEVCGQLERVRDALTPA